MTPSWPAAAGVAAVLAIGASVAVAVQAACFDAHLRMLERHVGEGSGDPQARSDLPPEVLALAQRLGAQSSRGVVTLRQRGQMWSAPGARPMAFEARQTASPSRIGYLWRARMGPGRLVTAADYYVAGVGGLEVKALGALSFAHQVGGPEMAQGEALRYLAELPWNPDAILLNHDLAWTVVTPTTLRVAQGPAAITFILDKDGLPKSMSAPSRGYLDKGRIRPMPWQGRFSHYQRISGRLLPTQGEVAWVIDGTEFIYWRGDLTAWTTGRETAP
ncbi:DUF6544 family protein [Phenylobacterium sp.]|uniref:DUF6544 family protein n=1 Tax=Phenylobacterium sp. TaxID=1871053 RepID=UPI0025EFAA3E|nr:DUF6544 family protein [Phenylobacterium sp.]